MERLNQVKKTVVEISEYVKNGLEEEEIKNKYSDFVKQYPTLFMMIVENGNYMEIFDKMIEAAKTVQTGQVTAEEMDKRIGYDLAREYIYPHIDMKREKQEKPGH